MLIFITNAAKSQTRQDLLNAICSAVGTTISFDYRKGWVHDDLIAKTDDFFLNQDVLIVYYLPSAKDKTGKDVDLSKPEAVSSSSFNVDSAFVFHPVRYGKVKSIVNRESSFTFEIELKEWYEYKPNSKANSIAGSSFQKTIAEHVTLRPKPSKRLSAEATGEEKTTFVSEIANNVLSPNNFGKTNTAILSMSFFAAQQGLSDSTLFAPICDRKSLIPATLFNGCPAAHDGLSSPGIQSVKIPSGTSLTISFMVIHGLASSSRIPEIFVDKSVATVIGPVTSQCNGGQIVTCQIVFAPQVAKRDLFIVARARESIEVANKIASGTAGEQSRNATQSPVFAAHVKVAAANYEIHAIATCSMIALVLASIDLTVISKIVDKVHDVPVGSSIPVWLFVGTKALAIVLGVIAWSIATRRGIKKVVSSG